MWERFGRHFVASIVITFSINIHQFHRSYLTLKLLLLLLLSLLLVVVMVMVVVVVNSSPLADHCIVKWSG